MSLLRRLFKQLAPVQKRSDELFAEQEDAYRQARDKQGREQAELLRESRERQRELLKRP